MNILQSISVQWFYHADTDVSTHDSIRNGNGTIECTNTQFLNVCFKTMIYSNDLMVMNRL